MNEILAAVLTVGGLGLVFGCLLAYAYSVFYVPQDERIDKINEILPGANCGACGYAGCSAYAAALVSDNAPVNACAVGKTAVAQAIADILGKNAGDTAELTAHILCSGDCDSAPKKYHYAGVPDCISLSRLSGGDKECSYGCLGLGTCVSVCKFGALSIKSGIASVDIEKCTGCGVCLKHCPKKVITLIPKNRKIFVKCSNTDKGAAANKQCANSCIGCRLCEKSCPVQAITVKNNLAVIDYTKCLSCGICMKKCPRHVIASD